MKFRIPSRTVTIMESLYNRGPMTLKDITSQTEISLRTVSYTLRKLMGYGFLRKTANLLDMRAPLYSLNNERLQQVYRYEHSNPLIKVMPGIFQWKKTA
ncbi:MAG: MarR family transcriptional regulator [Candidatus Thorarchaeota archaeon]